MSAFSDNERALYRRYVSGAAAESFNPSEARVLAAAIMRVHATAYKTPTHVDHSIVSEDVAALHRVAAGPQGSEPI